MDAFAGTHRLKDQDGCFDFSNAIHMRYMELLEKEREFDKVSADLQTWRNYAGTQEATTKVQCEALHMTVLPLECAACAEKRLQPKCPKAKPLERGSVPA